MTTATEQIRAAERRTPDVSALPPDDFSYPDPIREALDAARTAGQHRDEAEAQRTAAHAEVDQAVAADRAADKAALAAGKAMPKRRAEAAARDAAAEADRRALAAEANYRERFDALAGAITQHRGEWERELKSQIEAQQELAIKALAGFQSAFNEITLARRALDGLTEFRPGARRPWSGVSFGANPAEERRRTRKRERMLTVIDNRGRIGMDSGNVDEALLKLELLARDYKPGV